MVSFEEKFKFPKLIDEKLPLFYISWSANSQYIAGMSCGKLSGTCRIWVWNAQTGDVKQDFENIPASYIAQNTMPKLNSSGEIISLLQLDVLYFWDVKTGSYIGDLNMADKVSITSWHPRQKIVALGTYNGSIHIVEIQYP